MTREVSTIAGMSDSIFLVGDDGSLTEASSSAYDAEAEFQKLLADNPHLLPGAQIDRDNPRRWLLVKRGAGVPDREAGGSWWSIDHLMVDQDAVPTFVEVKRDSSAALCLATQPSASPRRRSAQLRQASPRKPTSCHAAGNACGDRLAGAGDRNGAGILADVP